MAAQVDIAVDQKDSSGATTLPVLQEGRPNLVSPPQGERTPSLKETASQWASDIRTRLCECIGQGGEVSTEDVCELEREIITSFITALQQDSHSTWMLLCEKLALLEPFKGCFPCFVAKEELFHYLERILHHVELHKERLFDVQVTQTLNKVFPKEVCEVREKGRQPARTYCGPSPPLIKPPCSPRKPPRTTLPDGSDPFRLRLPDNDESYLVVKPLSFGDLRKSFGAVALEVASREAVWGHCLGTTFQALSTNIPEEPSVVSEDASKCTSKPTSVEATAPSPRDSPSRKKQASPRKPMTGREAVQYLAGCHHVGKIETLFFNIAPNRHFRPYDLIEVHQNDANKEHFVFSTFSILHVYGDKPSEKLSLAEWQREAVLWNAVSHIPFFKNYLVSKMFHRWRTNKQRVYFLRKQKLLEEQLLQAVPRYGAALLQISRLLKELLTVNFLPLETEASYTIASFENLINYRNGQADKTLEKFFNYFKVTADVTAEESFKLLAYCEDQVQKKSVFSKDSLHLQRLKKEQREANLQKARRETGRLGNLVSLMDRLVLEHLFEIARTQVCRFVDQVMRSRHTAPDRDGSGLFNVNLIFTKHDVLGLSPTKEKILSTVVGTLRNIPAVLCARVTPEKPQGAQEPQRDAASAASTHKSTKGLVKALDLRRKQSSAMSPSTPINATLDSDRSKKTLTTMISDRGSEAHGSCSSRASSRETKSPRLGSLLTEEEFPAPELPKWAEPTKAEDDLGVATPDLVLKREPCLLVDGEGFMGQYHPLTTANLQQKLAIDKEFQAYLESAEEMVEAAMLEVEQYCEANAWLNPIHQFASHWTDRSVRGFAGVAAFSIEQKLNEIRQWSERIRIFDQSFLTENGLIYIDCCHIHDNLRPQLDKIYLQLVTFVADEVKRLSKEFCKEMSFVVYTLKEKRKTVEAFAGYAKNFNLFKKNTPQYQQQLDYIKSLFEVIRMSYRQLSGDEEKLEESVLQSWEAFLYQIQAASEFVNTQTPLFSQQLENTYTVLEKEAYELVDKGTSGIFLNPNQDPTQVLTELKKIRMRFFSVREQLTEASWRREAISGDPYDLTYLSRLTQRLDVRYELWKYVEVSSLAVADWKNMLFKKLNTRKALEKLVEWQTAAGHLKVHLPQGDEVLALWYRTLQDFKTKLPLLHKLRHESLKERHWKAIFVGIGDVYDPRRELLVSELLSFNLDYNDRLIEQICGNALGEYDLEVQIQKTAKSWGEREFKLAKHIPDSVYNNKDLQHKMRQSSRGRSKLEKFRMEKEAAMVDGRRCLDVTTSDFYILTGAHQLQYELEDSLISIHAMLNSPHLACMEQEVKFWSKALNQIQEITELWLSAQEKWLFLLKVFEQPENYRRFACVSFKFESINKKFQDFMKVVLLDPKCVSVTNHRRGDKGYRLLQGDNLAALLTGLITAQEVIVRELESLLEEVREDFPRLHFLSDTELVAMLGVSRNPEALVPTVSKCFLGIENVKFSLPLEFDSLNSALDYTLHADKLCGVSIEGRLGETVSLCESLEPQPHPAKWLATLERLMRISLAQLLQAAVQARMEGAPTASSALEELRAASGCDKEHGQEPVFQHWLLKFPAQCVLVSEAVLWEKTMTRILDRQKQGDLDSLISRLQSKVEEYTGILKNNIRGKVDPLLQTRLRRLLSNLVGQAIYTRDVTADIKKSGRASLCNFDWLKVLKYHIDIKSVLRAKTEVLVVSGEDPPQTSPRSSRRASSRSSPSRQSCSPMDKVPEEESTGLPRTKTTVSSAFSFSQCVVHMLGSPFSYDYEYHGPSSRLVLTPLTERAFVSLTSTLQSFHCGSLVGPPASGKSQTIQELSQAMGRHLVTVSCNEEITLPLLTQYLSGVIQSGSWVLFDNAGRLTEGLMSVLAQQLDSVRSALKALSDSNGSQYNLRGQPKYDKKPGTGEKVIRRNSLTTLHPLPPDAQPCLPRQNTVPHGFNEKGLSTYFEDRWVEEREGRRHSIEKEIRIQESELYKSNKPPPLFYEHVMSQRRKSSPDFSKLSPDDSYQPHYMGNLMFNGRLMLANVNYGCFMTFNSNSPTYSTKLPHQLRLLIRPCALVIPDSRRILEVLLYAHGFEEANLWTNKLTRFLYLVGLQLPSKPSYSGIGLREMTTVISLAGKKRRDHGLDREMRTAVFGSTSDDTLETQTIHSREEFCLVTAVNQVLFPRMETLDDRLHLRTILTNLFPSTIRMEKKSDIDNPKLKETLAELLRQNNQFSSEDFLNKILQLQSAVEVKRGAVLVGPSGSGKSTCYRTLAEAWNHLNYQLFAPDHTKEQIDIHKMIISATPVPQAQEHAKDSDYDYNRLEMKEVLKLQSLEAEEREARQRWRRAEKDLVSLLNTKMDIQNQGSEVTPTHALYPKVHLLNVTPNALTPEQLFGSFDEGVWRDGILTQTLREMETQSRAMNTVLTQSKVRRSGSPGVKATQELPSYLLQWLILDGTINPSWSENLNTMLDEHRRLSSADRENVGFQDSAMVLFETSDLSWASPAMVARTTVIHFDSGLVQWKWLYDSWAETCKTEFMLTSSSLTVLNDLVTEMFGPTLKFLANECVPSLMSDISQQSRRANQTARGIQEVSSFLKILSSLLSRCFLRDDLEKRLKKMDSEALSVFTAEEESGRPSTLSRSVSSRLTTTSVLEEIIPNHLPLVKAMFVFSYVWAFGGHLQDRHKEKFDKFVREMLLRTSHPLRLPSVGLVYDYQVDSATGGLVPWSERSVDRPRGLSPAYVVTPEVDCYQFLLELLLGSGHSVLLTGPAGVGKSSLVQNVVALKQKLTRVQMSPRLTSDLLRSRLLSHLQDTGQGQPVMSSGSSLNLDDKRLTFFIDDLNTAHGDQFCQPPLELLREVLSEGRLADLARRSLTDTREATFLTLATSPSEPGSGLGRSCHVMSSRLTRLLVTLTYFEPCPGSVLSIVRKPVLAWLEEFPTYSVEHHQDFADAMSLGVLELYREVKEKFRPTPAHAHYVFSFHDVARTTQGLLLMSPRSRTRKIHARRRNRDNARSRVGIEALEDMLRQTSNVSSGSVPSGEGSAPMMRLIAQLWCHECTRVFSDRLISPQDFAWYQKTLESVAVKHFCSPRDHWQTSMAAIDEEPSSSHYISRFTPVNSQPLTPSEESNKGKSPTTATGYQSMEMPDFATPRGQSSSASRGQTPVDNDSQGSAIPQSAPISRASAESTQDNATTARSQSTSRTEPGPNDTLVTTDTEAPPQTDLSSEDEESSEEDLSSETDSGDSDLDKTHDEGSPTAGGQAAGQADVNPIAAALASRRISKQSRRSVTFKMGLIVGSEQDSYDGPLMTIEELKGGHKNLTEIMFSKYYMKVLTEAKGLMVEKGYVETSESKLTEALYLCLKAYNTATSQQLDVAFFSDAVRHAARLSRVLATPGGHALLIGVSYSTGRSTLTKLAACVAQRKVYEPKPQATPAQTRSVLREHIRRCCLTAGVGKRPAVLLVHEALGEECLRDVSCVISDGTCPGLYTEDQLRDVVAQMMPGGVQTKRVDKMDLAFQRFLKNIRQHLHVIVCLNYAGNSFNSNYTGLRDKLEMCPALIKHAVSIDVYRQWDRNAYVTMASRWLTHNNSKIHVPWSQTMKEEQITQASSAMGYVHLSARAACEQLYCHQTQPLRFYTPRTFMEFTRMFKVIAAHLAKREQGVVERYELLLGAMSEALATISGYKREVSELLPQFRQAKEHIQTCQGHVEEGRAHYKEELELCRIQEEKISELQRPMERLRARLSSAYDKARPSYEAAKRALAALDDKATKELGELKSYRQPPATVTWVVGALCVLFDRKEDWDSGKQLLLKENLVNDLIFYDKENIPPNIFIKLEGYVHNPDFTPAEVCQASAALSCMCAYIHAVYNYALIHKGTYPLRQDLTDAMSKIDKAQAKLGQMRLAATRKKALLEKSIENYKEAVKDCKALEKRIMNFEKRIRKCTQVVTDMKPHHTEWKAKVKEAKAHIETAPGDALITAACVCYFGPLDDKTRAELLQDWMRCCRAGNPGCLCLSTTEAQVSLSARLDDFMDQNLSVFSEGGFNPKDSNQIAESESVVKESQSDIVLQGVKGQRPDSAGGGASSSVIQGDNPPARVYRYRPSIQESSIGKTELRSDLDDVGSTLFSIDTEGSDTDEDNKSPLMLRQDFSLPTTLSSGTELQKWKLQGLPTDAHALQNALIMRVCCDNRRSVWPLLVDPDGQAEAWVRALQQSDVSMGEAEVTQHDSSTVCEQGNPSDSAPRSDGRHTRMSHFTADTTFTTFTMADDSYSAAETSISHPNKDDDNLRPVTSVTQSWDPSGDSIIVEGEISEPPRDRLWVVEADHPQLHYYLVNSIVHGFTVLVTHLERKPLDPVFRSVLFKQLRVDGEGNRVVRVGGTDYHYHTDFRLYLSTDLPLFTKGDGICDLPVEKMCVIGLGLSDAAMVTRLLDETMAVERAEFHTQVRTNNKDLIHNTKMLHAANEVICDKVLGMDTPLLKDKTLLAALQACEQDTERHRAILEETHFTRDSLQQKRQPYVSMATQAAMLYAIVRKMSVLSPLYYLPFAHFIQLFRKVLKTRNRGKGAAGDILARSQELSDATTGMIHKYVTLMMPEKHAILFSLLVAMERMRLKGELTNQEMALFINGFEVPEDLHEASRLEEKPDWLSEDTWARCMTLESLHEPFQGLLTSLLNHASQWEEYLNRPLVLMNPVPGTEITQKTIFQKCLLWKIICPDKVCMIAEALSVYELGAVISPPNHYDIKELYGHTDCGIPTLFIQPQGTADDGFSSFEPVHELKRLAREEGMDGRLRIVSYGVRSQMPEVRQALEDCATNGYWLLLENYNLAEPLDQDTFTLLKTIVSSHPEDKVSLHEEESVDWDSLTQSDTAGSEPVSVGSAVTVCPSFRLFVTTAADQGQLLPGILIQHGLKVHCGATRDFRSRLHKAYRNTAFLLKHWTHPFHPRSADQNDSDDKSEYVLPLALLHSVLLHRRCYGSLGAVNNNNWSLVDLVAATDMFRALSAQCDDPLVIAEVVGQVYGGQCTDLHDSEVVKAIGTTVLSSNYCPNTSWAGCGRLLDRLSREGGTPFSLKAALDSLHDITATSLSLPDAADEQLTATFSRVICRDLVRTVGAPELFVSLDTSAHDTKLQACLRELEDCVEDCPELPETSRDELSPLDVFYHYEVERYMSVIQTLKDDLDLLQRQQQGEISISPSTKVVHDSLSEDKIPSSWLEDSVPSCSSALEWLKALPEKLRKLSQYVTRKSNNCLFELSVFLHPSEFLHATLMDHARQEFKNAEQLQYEAKVLPLASPPTSAPQTGLYLTGLTLHNAAWDRSREHLTLTTPTSGHAHHLPLIWLSPTQTPPSRTSSASSNQSDSQVYFCPVFPGCRLEDTGHSRLVTRIAMATGRAHPSVWTERRVFISTECYL